MIYDIRLTIRHDYAALASGGRHVLRLAPRNWPGRQRLVSAALRIDPQPEEQLRLTDFFGNDLTAIRVAAPHPALDVSLTARVERLAEPAPDVPAPTVAGLASEVARWREIGPESPLHGRSDSPRIPADRDIAAFARAALATEMPVPQAVAAVGGAIFRHMAFDPEATDVDTAPGLAFASARGVCQDFAQIMIGGLRSCGIPAVYVSGYLRTIPPEGQPRLEGADAMHAWVRAWCGPTVGWIDWDPTNDCRAGTDHVTVAVGRDYGDVAPVRGILRTGGGQTSRQAVDVIPVV